MSTATTYYVNVYDLTRNYGGPEEGGWWYDSGELLESHECASEDEAWKLQRELEAEYPSTGKRFSVLGGVDFSVRVEDTPGESWPEYLPRYE